MTKAKNTKRALLASVLSMMLCMAMLVGSTFAWFTDSVTSGTNRIVAGNLDVELEYAELNDDGSIKEWKSAEKASLFDENALWEPGYTQVVYLRVRNAGTLALNYQFSVNVLNQKPGVTYDKEAKQEKRFNLSDYLVFGADTKWDGTTVYANREAAQTAAGTKLGLNAFTSKGTIEANGTEEYVALVVYMPTTVGNEANYYKNPSNAPEITLGIELFATQAPVESDSFNNKYDESAFVDDKQENTSNWYEDGKSTKTYTVSSGAELFDLATKVNAGDENLTGATIALANDIDIGSYEDWTPIGTTLAPFTGSFNGNGHTVKNLSITKINKSSIGLFGTIKNATVENVVVNGLINIDTTQITTQLDQMYVCGVVGNMEGVSTISKVTNGVNITTKGEVPQVGGITGDIASSTTYGTNCTVTNCLNTGTLNCGEGAMLVGGISPTFYGGKLDSCVNVGEITGPEYMTAGIANVVNSNTTNCYSLNIPATQNDAQGKTDAEMKAPSTFSGLDTSIWTLVEGQYPAINH